MDESLTKHEEFLKEKSGKSFQNKAENLKTLIILF